MAAGQLLSTSNTNASSQLSIVNRKSPSFIIDRRDRIESAVAKGMAAQNAADRQPRAAPWAVQAQRFDRVFRARWVKSTVPAHQKAQRDLVEAHKQDERPGSAAHHDALRSARIDQ